MLSPQSGEDEQPPWPPMSRTCLPAAYTPGRVSPNDEIPGDEERLPAIGHLCPPEMSVTSAWQYPERIDDDAFVQTSHPIPPEKCVTAAYTCHGKPHACPDDRRRDTGETTASQCDCTAIPETVGCVMLDHCSLITVKGGNQQPKFIGGMS